MADFGIFPFMESRRTDADDTIEAIAVNRKIDARLLMSLART